MMDDIAIKMAGTSAPLIDGAEFEQWILHEDDHLLVMDNPGWVVCHPSKNGPRSSLVGAARLHTGLETLHLVSRLDRETSGIVLLAKHKAAARIYQMAMQERKVEKTYLAILEGELAEPITLNKRIARDGTSPIHVKQAIRKSRTSQRALTYFEPLATANGFTLAKIKPETGRKHQIRVHAQWLGHSIIGDKIYGPDENYYLQFIETGWSPDMETRLHLPRQALHATQIIFNLPEPKSQEVFSAPFPQDWITFCSERMGLDSQALADLTT